MNEERFYDNCFTELENGVNAEFNKVTTKCFDSVNNAFSMDCDGNLVVNSIITRQGNSQSIDESSIVNLIYPVGSIYMSVNSTSPATLFGGTWVEFGKGKTLVGVDPNQTEFNTVQKTGGSMTHVHSTGNCTLNVNQIPSHRHSFNGNTWGWGDRGNKLHMKVGSTHVQAVSENGTSNPIYSEQGCDGWINTHYAGGGQAHNHGNTGSSSNLQPYITCYMWKRES